MTHEEMRDMYEMYALGLLEGGERREIDEHLGRDCETCETGLRRALATNSAILSLAPDVAPPKRLRRRVLASVGVERQSWGWIAVWGAVTAGLLIMTLWYSAEVQRAHAELARIRPLLEILNSPETRNVVFGGQPQPPRGTVLMNPKNGVLLIAGNLPALPAGRIYEMWLIPKGGAPKPAGLFQPDRQGNAIHVVPGPVDASTGAVAITVEPEAGSAAPTTTPIVVAPVAGL
jgi:anti-sigma-K factor RskA